MTMDDKNKKNTNLIILNSIIIGSILICSIGIIYLAVSQGLFSSNLLRWYCILSGSLCSCFVASIILCTIPFLKDNCEITNAQLRTATILHYCGWLVLLAWWIVAIVLF